MVANNTSTCKPHNHQQTSDDKFAVQELNVSDIRVGRRHRKEMGNIPALAKSMSEVGLLQAIGIDPDFRLIWGARRLEAAKVLKWKTIPARIIDTIELLTGEHAENDCRKDLTVSERAAIGEAVEKALGNRQGQRTDKSTSGQLAGSPPGQESRQVAAQAAGMSTTDYRRAKEVVHNAAPEVVAAMDAREVSVSDAAAVASLPAKEQRQAVDKVRKGKAKTLKAAAASTNGQAEKPEPVTDSLGLTVPEHLREVFTDYMDLCKEMRSHVRKLNHLLTKACNGKHGHKFKAFCERVKFGTGAKAPAYKSEKLENFDNEVHWATPYASLCPWCYVEYHELGKFKKDCGACHGQGWVSKSDWNRSIEVKDCAAALRAAGAQKGNKAYDAVLIELAEQKKIT
jgi:hypothetical protein